MRILLLDNAIDSFEWSLRHFRTFLELDSHFETPDISTTYLKQGILSLNASLELFFKAKISLINPLLIYEHVSTDSLPKEIMDYYTQETSHPTGEPLYNYIIENSDIHTIDYSKCIEFYCTLYSVPQGYKEEFTILNNIRNKLTHLGISSQEEYFVLAGRIANVLNYVHFNILYGLDYDEDHLNKVRCNIIDIEFTFTSLEDSIWRKVNKVKIEYICNQIDNVFHSDEITSYLLEKNISADFGTTFDAEFMYGMFTMEKNNSEYEIASIYASPSKNALIVSDSDYKDGPVFAVFPLPTQSESPKKFYKSCEDSGTEIPNFDMQGAFWNTKPYGNNFAYVPFGKNQLIEIVKEIINFISIVKFINPET